MAIIRLSGFLGENRAIHPMLLPEGVGVTSLNQRPGRGDLRPWRSPATVTTVPSGRQTIYRMGRSTASDTNYWLSWTTTVHAVRGPNAADTAEKTYYTGSGTPKWTNTTLALATPPYPTSAMELGIPVPSTAPTLSASGGTSEDTESRYYVYTYVTSYGDEGPPSSPSTELVCKVDDTVTINSLSAPPAGNYGIDRIRVYRTQTGQSGDTNFFYLTEVSSSAGTATDSGQTLQEALPSTTWLKPPTDLKWLTGMWNGMMAGISDRAVRFCEAYYPHAWPVAYEILPTTVTPVALATFGQTLVVLTDGKPILVTGGSPDSMDEAPIEFEQACIAPLSAVGMGFGVGWASPDGLAFVGQGGARVLTEGVLTRDDWQALNPSTIKGCMYERRYFGFYNDGAPKAFMLDPANPQGIYFLDFGADALYSDDVQDAMYLLDGVNIKKWDTGSALTTTFKSKQFRMPRPVPAYTCAEVTASSYPVTFKLYADGALKHTESVASATPFRLPGGYRAQVYQIEVSTTGAIQGVAVAHTMQELAQV